MATEDMICQLKAEFADRAESPKSLFLLNPTDAVSFIEIGCKRGLVLAGVEGFFISEGRSYQPSQELSNDRADTLESDEKFRESTKHLILGEGVRTGAWFQVVFERFGHQA